MSAERSMTPWFRVTPSKELLVGVLSEDEVERLEEVISDREDLGFEYDRVAGVLSGIAAADGGKALTTEALGRPVDELVNVEGMVFFDWGAEGALEALEAACKSLPRWLACEHGEEWFGRKGTSAEYLWGSVEPPGFQIGGRLRREDWDAWLAVFLTRTACIARRAD